MQDSFLNNTCYEKVYKSIDNKKEFVSESIEIQLFEKLLHSMANVQKYCDLIILYTSLKDSIEELQQYLKSKTFGGKFKEYAKANRLTLNMLSSFYSLIEFCNGNFPKFKTSYSHTLYDDNFSYRLFYHLRIYMTHKSVAVTSFEMNLNGANIDVKANINLDEITNYSKINKKFKNELEKIENKTLSINNYVCDFNEVINKMIFTIFEDEMDNILDNLTFLKGNIPNSNENITECFIRKKGGKSHSLLKSITNFVHTYSNGVIYRNNIEKNPDFSPKGYVLFLAISSLYFNEAGVCVKPDL